MSASVLFYLAGEPTSSRYSEFRSSSTTSRGGDGKLSAARRWPALFVLVAANLLILFVFKYAGFVAGSVDAAAGTSLSQLYGVGQLALPLGISFFTFHGISYIVDVYRGTAPPQKDIFKFGIYFVFFPQLIAGPIIRYHDVAEQLADRNPRARSAYAERVVLRPPRRPVRELDVPADRVPADRRAPGRPLRLVEPPPEPARALDVRSQRPHPAGQLRV